MSPAQVFVTQGTQGALNSIFSFSLAKTQLHFKAQNFTM